MKRCSGCGEDLPLSTFTRRARSSDGLSAACRSCLSERKARYYAARRDAERAKRKAAYWADPAAKRAEKQRYYLAHAEERKAYARSRRATAQRVERDLTRLHDQYVLHRRGVHAGSVTLDQLRAKVAYWGDRCWMCGDGWDHIDHVKPLAHGGSHLLANLRPACARCNQCKNATWPFQTSRASTIPLGLAERALTIVRPDEPFDRKQFLVLLRRLGAAA